jgi:hypothetical protein
MLYPVELHPLRHPSIQDAKGTTAPSLVPYHDSLEG